MSGAPGAGDRIGPYELVAELGRGGYGTVWRAERREPYRQVVAIKFLRIGADSRAIVARFERERQALAVMNHPGIARVLDGGLAADGRPYLVMELVDGKPITEWCVAESIDVRGRIALFAQVCDAVQHAHVKGMIHRDLKPSNILAARDGDARQVARVIDFGIAKLIDASTERGATVTEEGQLVGTPEYMSPEQADPDGGDVDTRSDVYSLGAVLFELLTGRAPFGRDDGGTRSRAMVLRAVRTEAPAAPSSIAPGLPAELDWIVLRALRKEPAERYASAAELARDLRAFLEGGVLLAAPESAMYRFRSYARRNRVQVVAGAAILATLSIATGVSVWFALNESRARADAVARADEARRIAEFQSRMLDDVDAAWVGAYAIGDVYKRGDAYIKRTVTDAAELKVQRTAFSRLVKAVDKSAVGGEVIAKSFLDPAAEAIERDFADLPLVRAEFHSSLAGRYLMLGNIEKAQQQIDKALVLRRGMLGDRHGDVAVSELVLGRIALTRGDIDVAAEAFRRSYETRVATFGADSIEAIMSGQEVVKLLAVRGQHAEAVALAEALVTRAEQRFGRDDPRFIGLRRDHAIALIAAGRGADAEPIARGALESFVKVIGENGVGAVRAEVVLARAITAQGRLDEAEQALVGLVERMTRVYGLEDTDTVDARIALVEVRTRRDPAGVSVEELGQLQALARARFGPMSSQTRWLDEQLARRSSAAN